MSTSFYDVASDFLNDQDELVVDGDWLTDEQKVDLKIVTDREWEELALGLADYLEQAANEWATDNVKGDI
jgi:hypothetical protein